MATVLTFKLHHYLEQTQEGILSQIFSTKQNNYAKEPDKQL